MRVIHTIAHYYKIAHTIAELLQSTITTITFHVRSLGLLPTVSSESGVQNHHGWIKPLILLNTVAQNILVHLTQSH